MIHPRLRHHWMNLEKSGSLGTRSLSLILVDFFKIIISAFPNTSVNAYLRFMQLLNMIGMGHSAIFMGSAF